MIHYRDLVWKIANLMIVRPGRFLFHQRQKELRKRLWKYADNAGVLSGPFRGLRYPEAISAGSVILPKLLGTYESELHPFLIEITKNHYEQIVDIGCGEGFYAVGLAMSFPGIKVTAFDIDGRARALCASMAELNGVTSQVDVRSECSNEVLMKLVAGKRCLVVSDCEGFEKCLFDQATAAELILSDVVIEIHDFVDPEISTCIKDAFAFTHSMQVLSSISDHDKVGVYTMPFCKEPDYWIRRMFFDEGRPERMEWFIMRSRERK